MAPRHEPPYFGAAYYPEDWPAEQVDQDIALMQQAGMNVMRVAEFAWSCMEPREGQFEFGWLHRVVDKLGAAGIATILGTPTATPPAWLVERYPEVLGITDMGVRRQHGARRHPCPRNPLYRDLCARVVERMGDEFGRDANVIGWQIDNEVYVNNVSKVGCCCPVCQRAYREAMRQRYGSIEALNAAWCTNLWSQAYDSFEQLPVPRTDTWHHPSLQQTWMEVQSQAYVDYVAHQADILHARVDQPVGTDMMPVLGVNYTDMHRKLDLVQYNHYNSASDLWTSTFWMDYLRPIKPAPFWNTETSACWCGNVVVKADLPPGAARANAWLPFALGGEANLFWLWRAHWAGQELMHGSVLASSGRPMHTFGELQQVAEGLKAAGAFLRGTRPAPAALAVHYSSFAWTLFQTIPMVEGFLYQWELLRGIARPIYDAQLRPDVIAPEADLAPYRMVVSAYLPALDEGGLRERILPWVQAGGTWVVGPLSDKRNLDAAKFVHAPYGSLEEWTGVRCKYEIPAREGAYALRWADGSTSTSSIWCDGLEPGKAEVLATYADGWLEGLAAVTSTRVGKGRIVVLATMPAPQATRALLARLAAEAGVEPAAKASEHLLVVPRQGAAGRGAVAVETHGEPATLELSAPATDLVTGRRHEGRVKVAPYGVMVLAN